MSVPSRIGSCLGIAIRWWIGFRCLQNNVTTDLMHLRILPTLTQNIREMRTRQVSGNFHATFNISSRIRCKRTRSGRGLSKKNAVVASRRGCIKICVNVLRI
jgi:hypothetical protein